MDLDANRNLIAAALGRIPGGDRSALQTVYRLTSAKLFGVALHILGERSEAEDVLQEVLTYHVVPGRLSAKDLMAKIEHGHGKAMLKTVKGAELTFEQKNGKLWIIDAKGDMAQVTIRNVMQSNGVIHVIDTVLLPG